MDLLLSWVAFPLVLGLLAAGCGLALEALAGARMPGSLIPATGLAAMVVIGQFTALADETAALTTPVVVVLAALGVGLALARRRLVAPPRALLVALAALFAVYAAPIVLSGEATVAGFIKLDDTATWLAFTDQVMSNGRDLSGLAPSTHEAALQVNLGEGYPIGAFIPLGVSSRLLATDPAWLIQPYMALGAMLFGLAAWRLATPLVADRRARAAIAFVAAQPALLFGYYLWGGVKELLAAALIATAAALAAFALERPADPRRLVPLAVVSGAVIGVLSGGGGVWLVPILAPAAIALARRLPLRALMARVVAFVAGVVFLALPVLLPGGFLPPTSSPLDDADADGNLLGALDPLQVAGIWPAGDFRVGPEAEGLAYVLVALALALAVAGVAWAWRRRAAGILLALAAAVAGSLVLALVGSPWVEGKALATAAPFVLLAALLGCAEIGAGTRAWAGVVLGVVLATGVVWSNALAYRDVSLAPRGQLEELEEIGEVVAGEGPALMTEYSPYGARHFLRDADAESVSELRRRAIPRANGEPVPKGRSADTDELDPQALAAYRTLVLRRSPAQSRPPSAYRLIWQGEFYEVWQRPEAAASPARLALGSRHDPVARPACADVRSLAAGAGRLVGATRPRPVVVRLPQAESAPVGAIAADARVRRTGEYEIWLGGSVRPAAELRVDGEAAGSVRHELNNLGQYVRLGSARLRPGTHRIEVEIGDADLHPGSGGVAGRVGPLALTRKEAADTRLVRVPAAAADRLCGRPWDWIEAD
jgi:hypothetical protein